MSLTPEGKVKLEVRKIFRQYKIKYLHIPGSRFGKAGAPDYVCCVNGWYLAVECKAFTEQTELQKEEQKKTYEAGGIYVLVDKSSLGSLEYVIKQLLER